MYIPKTIKIKKSWWSVLLDSNALDTKKYNGMCVHLKKEILIDPALPRNELEETWIHEYLHALFPVGIVGHKKEEEIVNALAKRLCHSLRDSGLTIYRHRKKRR